MNRFLFFIICIYLFSCTTDSRKKLPEPPKIKKEIATDNYFDITIKDYYRNLENAEDSIVQKWYKSQGDYSNSILKNISGVDSLAETMQEFSKRKTYRIRRTAIVDNEQYFFLKKMPDEKKFKLYYKKGYKGKEEFVYDPDSFKPETKKNYVINYIRPSWDGQYVVVALTYKGREIAEMIIIDMKTKKPLKEIIDKSWAASFYGVDWLPDNSGFTYLHFPNVDENNKRSKKDTQAVLYKIGQDPKKINPIFSPQNNPELNLDSTSYPIIDIKNKNQKYAIAFMVNVTNYFDAYYTEIENLSKENIKWKPLFTIDDKIYKTYYSIDNDVITFKSGKNTPNYFIGQTTINDLNFQSPNKIINGQKNEIIDEFKVIPDGIFYTTIKNGVEAKFYKYNPNSIEEIKLPKISGDITLRSHNKQDLFVSIKGWTNKTERYLYKNNQFKYTPLSPVVRYPEFDDLVVKEIEVPSHDGTMVPLSIIHHKDTKLDGKNPLFIYGYGSYGDNTSPVFSTIFLSWTLKGGILCAAHVRGGGEKGEEWHTDGQKINKPNTWKDFIACTEYLIKNKYTSNKHIAAWSGSAGGIMVGRAITERPDLYRAIIIDAGSLNPIRREASFGGGSNYKEFGSIKDSLEYKGIIEMDSYYHLKENTKYPAILLNAGMNDPRVAPWQSGKFAARLQEINKSNHPILFNVDYNAGHGSGTTIGKVYRDWAEKFAFAFWQIDHPDFKLSENIYNNEN